MSTAIASEDAPTPSPRSNQRGKNRSERLALRLGLKLVTVEDLTIVRHRKGRGFGYRRADGAPVRDRALIDRLNRLAVPPAYADALYSADPRGHLQAVWRDAAGRLQYRYHAEWEKVRDDRKLRRLSRLAQALPRIRRAVRRRLAEREPSREFAFAAVIELVAASGIRAGREDYARNNGTRGAATLLKSDVAVRGNQVLLCFRAKGGKTIEKELKAPRLAAAFKVLCKLPGRRLFQFRNGGDLVKPVRAAEVNRFLQEIAGLSISLKDFRMLTASAAALRLLARTQPRGSERQRKKQVRAAMQTVSEQLANTPAIARKSYVPAQLVEAFEQGKLRKFAANGNGAARSEQLLSEILG